MDRVATAVPCIQSQEHSGQGSHSMQYQSFSHKNILDRVATAVPSIQSQHCGKGGHSSTNHSVTTLWTGRPQQCQSFSQGGHSMQYQSFSHNAVDREATAVPSIQSQHCGQGGHSSTNHSVTTLWTGRLQQYQSFSHNTVDRVATACSTNHSVTRTLWTGRPQQYQSFSHKNILDRVATAVPSIQSQHRGQGGHSSTNHSVTTLWTG